MNYVEYFDLFGVEAKQIPCILGSGAPTTTTEGAVGCFYMDTDSETKDVYKCTAVSDGVYTWANIGSGGGGSGTVTAVNAVLYTEQTLTDEQKAQARANIGVDSVEGAVLYTEQTLDADQQKQARENISAASEDDLVLLGKTTKLSKNMINPNDPDYVVDIHMSGVGTRYVTAAGWNTTGYMTVTPGDRVAIWGDLRATNIKLYQNLVNLSRIYGYDADKGIVSSAYAYNGSLVYYTVPDGVYYLRVSYGAGTYPLVMIFKLEDGEDGNYVAPDYPTYEPCTASGTTFNIPSEFVNVEVPTKTSQLENDSGFLTKASKPLALPHTMYAFANQPVVTFLRNILPYHPDDVYVRMTTSNKGKLFADRWEYTPTAAETVTVKYIVCDHNYNELNNDTFSLVVKNTTEKESLTVLVIGDSTVNAGTETQKMLDLATADGYSLTLLGTRGTPGSTNQHEGRGGWTAEMYCTQASNTSGSVVNAFYNADSEAFDFSYYMTQQGYSGVDCVFIQLGINDLFSYKTDADLATATAAYLSYLETMINSIHAYDSNIKIVLNMIIPCCDDQDEFTAGGGNYGMVQTTWRCRKNTYDGNIALMEKFENTTNVYISQYNAALDTVNNMDGGVHPVQAGYEQLGMQMYSFMRAIN